MVTIPPGSNLGRYRIGDQLGRGGMATVFKAHDPLLDRDVAIKVLPSYYTEDPTFVDRFAQEAQAIARLNHPNILQIYDFGEDKGFTYIVMELVPGGTLQNKLYGEPLSLEETLDYMKPLAEALDHAHSQGIIHRDLKPANVLLDSQSRPILADFGLARMLQAAVRFTQAQEVLGTPQYMSPEQALGGDLDERSDIYSFGVMVYEMLVGRAPFMADTPTATLMAHIHQPPPRPSALNVKLDARLEAPLLKVLSKDPNGRFPSAKAFIESLQGVTTGTFDPLDTQATMPIPQGPATLDVPADGIETAVAAPPVPEVPAPTAPEVPTPPARRRWLAGVGAIVSVAIVAAVGFIVVSNGGEPETGKEPTSAQSPPVSTPIAPTPIPPTPVPATPVPPTPVPTSPPPAVVASPQATATPSATPTPGLSFGEYLATLRQRLTKIKSRVVLLRNLPEKEEINPKFDTREKLAELTEGIFKRRTMRDEVFELDQLYKSLDLMEESDSLEEITLGIATQQISALFDDDTKILWVLSDAEAIGPVEELSYAGAFAAGLQDQHFDISAIRRQARDSGNFDRLRAVNAFTQGDVSVVLVGYSSSFFAQEQWDELSSLPDNLLTVAPNVVRKVMLLPQRDGGSFVAGMYGTRGNWDAVNSLYERPPVSTEQILHPDKYVSAEEPVIPELPELEVLLNKGWNPISINTMGEFLLRTYLEEYLDKPEAAAAAAGWGGDRYALMTEPEGHRVLAMVINWDTPEDSGEFFDLYQSFAEKWTGEASTQRGPTENERWWISPDKATFLRNSGPASLLIIGDSETVVLQVLALFPGP